MKTTTLTLPSHSFIDTAPLVSRYDVLARAVLAMTLAGQYVQSMLAARKIVRLVRIASQLEAHNAHLRRKLDMLSHKPWRDTVLRDLGGVRKLTLWVAAKERRLSRIKARASAPLQNPKPKGPAWLYTPERIAESERLKARKREVFRAGHNPLIVRDRCKMDAEGEFRLAPLPRGDRAARQMRIYTESSIVEYDWNPMPFEKEKGFGPASVWPVEFYAAMEIEAEILAGREVSSFVIPDQGEACRSGTQPPTLCSQNSQSECLGSPTTIALDDGDPASGVWCPNPSPGTQEELEERDERGGESYSAIPLLPLKDVLTSKVQQDLFGALPQETSLVGS